MQNNGIKMIELFEPLNPYLPIITVGLAIWNLLNSIKTRKQTNALKKQDLALKQLEREDRFRYKHPHMYVCLEAFLPVGEPPTISKCEIVVANRDERNVRVESIEWAYGDGSSWPIENLKFQPTVLGTSESLSFNIERDVNIFRFSSNKASDMIFNILDLSIKVKLSTDDGRIYSIDNPRLKRALLYNFVDSYVMRKLGEYLICRKYHIGFWNLFL